MQSAAFATAARDIGSGGLLGEMPKHGGRSELRAKRNSKESRD